MPPKHDSTHFLFITISANAILFATGHTRSKDLLRAGIGMKIIDIIVILVASILLISPVFHISNTISISNSTISVNVTNG